MHHLTSSVCAGGGFRIARKPIKIAGFDIDEGVVVTADPRIGNKDESLFPSPGLYKPERWMPSSSGKCPLTGTAAQLPKAAWFPGGTGVHQCPGVPLAELCAKVLLSKWLAKFESWDEVSGPPDLILVPIKIPKDSYEVALKCRDREAAVAATI